MSLKKIIFFKVKTNSEKIKKIIQTAYFHLAKNIPLTVLVPDEKVQLFIDELLWKIPDTSFLPHSTDNSEIIQIKVYSQKTPFPKHVFNLCPYIVSPDAFLTIYELEDLTSKEKQKNYQEKIKAYQETKTPIESK